MASDVDICNMALSKLAADRITSFDDNTISAKECKAVYNMIVRYVQAKGPWTTNMFRTGLAQTNIVPSFGFAYAYQLPVYPLNLRVLKINEDDIGDVNYRIEDGLLLSNEAAVSILYIGLLTDSQTFGPYLEESIIDHLVAQMAYKFTGQQQVAEGAVKYAETHLQELLNLDGVQGANDTLPSDTFIDVRLSSGPDLGGEH